MRIVNFQSEPLTTFVYLNAGRGPGQFYADRLPVHHARVDRLPKNISAIVVTSDLQGRETFQDAIYGAPRLFGEVVPERLVNEVFPLLSIRDQAAAFLAGDFFTVPELDKRGGTGDVSGVWRAFADRFSWVAGVAGNHDLFDAKHAHAPEFSPPLHFLDGQVVSIHGVRIGGLGGIIGNPSRPQRRTEEDYLRALDDVLRQGVDVLLMHEGPNGPGHAQWGVPEIRAVIEKYDPCLIIRGHTHWDEPFAECSTGLQILNVDARVVILTQS